MSGGHLHTRGCACDHDAGDSDGASLLPSIDKERVTAQNERHPGSARSLFRPFETRLEFSSPCESIPGDPDLIIQVPFTSSVRVKSISILCATEGTTPRDVHLFVNRDDIDFESAEDTPPAQSISLSVDPDGALFYPLRATKFSNVSSLTLVFRGVHGSGSIAAITFVGLKGIASAHRRGVVTAVYEAKPMPQDHAVPDEKLSSETGV